MSAILTSMAPVGSSAPDSTEQPESRSLADPFRDELRIDNLIPNVTAGIIVGELGLLLGETRTASVDVEKPGVVLKLTDESLQRMKREEPRIAVGFLAYLNHLLAERVSSSVGTIQSVLE